MKGSEVMLKTSHIRKRLTRFVRDDSGSHTIEAVIWMPMFVIVLALVLNVTIVFFQESQMLRVVQDGNRLLSVGRMLTEVEVEDYITNQLSYLSENLTVDTVVDGGTVTTLLTIPATDMMPMSLLKDKFTALDITVQAQQFVEY